jgi:hypothetical protein
LVSIKRRIAKTLAAVKPGRPIVVLCQVLLDAGEVEREMARDAALLKTLAKHLYYEGRGPVIFLCLEVGPL